MAVTTGLPAASAALSTGSRASAAGDLDDHVDLGVADQLERPVGARDVGGERAAVLVEIADRDPRDPEAHAVALGDRAALALDHLEQAAPDGAAADQADADLADRLDADARRTAAADAGLTSSPNAPAPRSRSASRSWSARNASWPKTESSFHSDDVAPTAWSWRWSSTCSAHGNSMSPGTPTTRTSAVTCSSGGADRGRVVAERAAVDGLAEQQEGLDRESRGEAPAVVIEVLGDRRPLEPGHQLAEPGVELVAAAVGQHAELAGADHARSRRRPGARPSRTSSRWTWRVAVPQPSGRSPAEIVIRPGAARRVAGGEREADHAAEAGADERDRLGAADAVEPGREQIGEAAHRQRREAPRRRRRSRARSSRCRASPGTARCGGPGSTRSGARSAGHQGSPAAPRLAVAERQRRRGDAADDHDHRRGAELGAIGPATERRPRRARGPRSTSAPARPRGGGGGDRGRRRPGRTWAR